MDRDSLASLVLAGNLAAWLPCVVKDAATRRSIPERLCSRSRDQTRGEARLIGNSNPLPQVDADRRLAEIADETCTGAT
jgi:hypothetical protein